MARPRCWRRTSSRTRRRRRDDLTAELAIEYSQLDMDVSVMFPSASPGEGLVPVAPVSRRDRQLQSMGQRQRTNVTHATFATARVARHSGAHWHTVHYSGACLGVPQSAETPLGPSYFFCRLPPASVAGKLGREEGRPWGPRKHSEAQRPIERC